MLIALSSYIKNLAIFIIFISFIGIILPSDKYKNYINIVLGFMLMFVLINPVVKHLNTKNIFDLDSLYLEVGVTTNSDIERENLRLEEMRSEIIVSTYTARLWKELESILSTENKFLEDLNVDFDMKNGDLQKLELTISREQKELSDIKSINIEAINIGENFERNLENEEKDIKIIKNLISGFYNLSTDNIHINMNLEE